MDVTLNARGHHAVPPYVLRAVPGAGVSMPRRRAGLRPGLDLRRFNLHTAPARLARLQADPLAVFTRAGKAARLSGRRAIRRGYPSA